MGQYLLERGSKGAERLQLLSRILSPTTEALLLRAGLAPGWRCLGANRQLIAHLLPTADRSVFVEANRQLIAQFSVGCACLHRAMGLLPLLSPARVNSVGNRQRPHHG